MGNRTRQFSLTRPIMYQGENYPSTEADISYGNGVEDNGRIFVDANGNYFTLDENGNAMEAMLVENLDEVIIKPSNQEMLANAFNSYLTMSNDNTQVSNLINEDNSPLVNKAMSEANNYYSSQNNSNEDERGTFLYKLLNYIDPKPTYKRYANSLSPYTFQDDKDRTGKISQGPLTTGNEVSSRLGNLGLVKVGDNSYRLYDENGNTIKQCAKTRNELEKMVGRPTTNNAWDTFGMYGDSTLFNGYPQKIGPYNKLSYIIHNQIAAKRAQDAIEDLQLQTGDVVDLYSPFTHYAKEAYNTGTLNRSNSHTGIILQPYPGAKAKTYIIHNVNGNISVDPIGSFLFTKDNPFPKWRVTGFHRPGTKEHPYLKNGKPAHL